MRSWVATNPWRLAIAAFLAFLAGMGAGWLRPQGGFFIWVRLPDGVQDEALFEAAITDGTQDIILAKMGGKAQRTNVAGGMSGSPVYIDGKLVGAVAFSFNFAKASGGQSVLEVSNNNGASWTILQTYTSSAKTTA